MTASKVLKKHQMRACKVIASALNIPVKNVPGDSTANSWDQWDSLTHMKIILSLEADLGITLPLEKIMDVSSVSDIAAVIAEVQS